MVCYDVLLCSAQTPWSTQRVDPLQGVTLQNYLVPNDEIYFLDPLGSLGNLYSVLGRSVLALQFQTLKDPLLSPLEGTLVRGTLIETL